MGTRHSEVIFEELFEVEPEGLEFDIVTLVEVVAGAVAGKLLRPGQIFPMADVLEAVAAGTQEWARMRNRAEPEPQGTDTVPQDYAASVKALAWALKGHQPAEANHEIRRRLIPDSMSSDTVARAILARLVSDDCPGGMWFLGRLPND